MEEKELVKGCKEGNEKCRRLLYEQYSPVLMGICLRYTKNEMEAEDLLHDAFIKIFTKLDSYRGEGSFEGWMKTIMINTAIDYQRKYKKMNELVSCEEVSEAVFSNAESNVISKMSSDELLKLVQELPPMSKNVFNLFVFDGFSHTEIAGMLQIKEGTSFWHLNNARSILKEKIRKLYQI